MAWKQFHIQTHNSVLRMMQCIEFHSVWITRAHTPPCVWGFPIPLFHGSDWVNKQHKRQHCSNKQGKIGNKVWKQDAIKLIVVMKGRCIYRWRSNERQWHAYTIKKPFHRRAAPGWRSNKTSATVMGFHKKKKRDVDCLVKNSNLALELISFKGA